LEEFAKNLIAPIGLVLTMCYILYALAVIPYPLNYLFGVVVPIVSASALALHYYSKRAEWELDDKIFPDAARLEQLSEELRARAESRRG
jgi:uncharacterized membrane-anchored protein